MIHPIQCSLKSLNKKKTIFNIFNIKNEARNLDYDFAVNYEYKFFYKGKEKIAGKANLINEFLKVEKDQIKLIDEIPFGEDKKMYRPIINHKKDAEWLKKAQRKFHKIIIKGLGNIEYLHSTTKGTSYASNGRAHAGYSERYLLSLDISSFFTGISQKRVFKTLKEYLLIDSDIAYYYSKMLTAPLEKNSKELFLAQGLPSSPIIAYLCYKSLFDYINDVCAELNIKFTLYVDDMTFSSEKRIPQVFINKVLGILKSKKYNNNLIINKRKTHNYKKKTRKKVTGVYINNGVPTISGKKHFELFVLYTKLIEIIHGRIDNIDDYFDFYNLFLKFSGNLIHLFQVEHNGDINAPTGCFAHDKMANFYKTISHYIKPGLPKKENNKKYSKDNINKESLKIAETSYSALIKNLDKINKEFPQLNRDILQNSFYPTDNISKNS